MYRTPINQWQSQFMKPKTSRSNYVDWTYVTPMVKKNNVVTNYDTRDDTYESFKNYVDHVMSSPQGRKHRPKNKKHKRTRGLMAENLNPIESIQPIGEPVQVPETEPETEQVVASVPEEVPVVEVPEEEPEPEAEQVVPEPEEEAPVADEPVEMPEPEPEIPPTQGFYDPGEFEYDTYSDDNN